MNWNHTLRLALLVGIANLAPAQDQDRDFLASMEWGDERSEALTAQLRKRSEQLPRAEADSLRAQLMADPGDLLTRMVLVFYEEPAPRRKRGEQSDPRPHGKLVLGLIEEHPGSHLACNAGLLLYPYKRDGMYTGPAWEEGIALWERLVEEHPKDPAIACNAGSFLISDPFRMATEGPRALELLQRARDLDPKNPRWALKLGGYHSMLLSLKRGREERAAAAAKAGLPHLRAAWDLTPEFERGALTIMGRPISMVLATAYFAAGDLEQARPFANLALEGLDPEKPEGDVVFRMNELLGRIVLAADDTAAARRYLLAAGRTVGSPVLGSFGPSMILAQDLLKAGERDTVIAFLESCKVFWHSGKDRLGPWILTIREGGNPWPED